MAEKQENHFVEGLAVSGEYVKTLKDKHFVILRWRKEEMPDLDNPKKMIKKLILKVELAETGEQMDYYPNKTSQSTMAVKLSSDLNKWLGKAFEWEVSEQKVMGNMKQVLFVKADEK